MNLRVVGFGNRWRHDDGVGLWMARRLRDAGIVALEHEGDGAGLMDLWQGAASVVLIDATRSGFPAGTVRRFDAVAAPVPSGCFFCSSHQFGLAEAVETARVLGRLPERLEVIGIEGADFTPGEGLTAAVEQSALELVLSIGHIRPA